MVRRDGEYFPRAARPYALKNRTVRPTTSVDSLSGFGQLRQAATSARPRPRRSTASALAVASGARPGSSRAPCGGDAEYFYEDINRMWQKLRAGPGCSPPGCSRVRLLRIPRACSAHSTLPCGRGLRASLGRVQLHAGAPQIAPKCRLLRVRSPGCSPALHVILLVIGHRR